MSLKHALRDVISGKSPVRCGTTIQTVASHLRAGAQAGRTDKDRKQIKREEGQRLILQAKSQGLWISAIDPSRYVSEGAEQKVYLKDEQHVLKLNDSIYFETWSDYLNNLLVHNYLFADTAYDLIGFTLIDQALHAVVQQPYVVSTHTTELMQVQEFMARNGFRHTRNNDYFNPEAGVILEDLHDENVLTQNGCLYFIDTVFYLTEEFWKDDHADQ